MARGLDVSVAMLGDMIMCCDNCGKKSEQYYQVIDDKYCKICAEQYEKSLWRTAKVFTKAPGLGKDREIQELGIITVRPNESDNQALMREGFNPDESRIEIIDF